LLALPTSRSTSSSKGEIEMRSTILGSLLVAGACLIFGPHLGGQQSGPESPALRGLEVAVLYNSLLSNVARADRFWMQGGSIQVDGQFWRGLGVEADISGFHTQNANNEGVGLNMITAAFGPSYRWSPAQHRYSFFAHALVGEANGFDSIFPGAAAASSSANGLALQLGGALDLSLKHHLLMRIFEVDWLRTELPNADTNVQNNVRLATGVVVRFQ
jgi:hypothetical protein